MVISVYNQLSTMPQRHVKVCGGIVPPLLISAAHGKQTHNPLILAHIEVDLKIKRDT
jgi:hypothetical protein